VFRQHPAGEGRPLRIDQARAAGGRWRRLGFPGSGLWRRPGSMAQPRSSHPGGPRAPLGCGIHALASNDPAGCGTDAPPGGHDSRPADRRAAADSDTGNGRAVAHDPGVPTRACRTPSLHRGPSAGGGRCSGRSLDRRPYLSPDPLWRWASTLITVAALSHRHLHFALFSSVPGSYGCSPSKGAVWRRALQGVNI
jgi:hypothetical protein